jgi:hypothetical protein
MAIRVDVQNRATAEARNGTTAIRTEAHQKFALETHCCKAIYGLCFFYSRTISDLLIATVAMDPSL